MRVMVTGSRICPAEDELKVWRVLDHIHYSHENVSLILGDARGVDTAALSWAAREDYVKHHRTVVFKADWTMYGKSAGMIRNKRMVDEGMPDLVLAFPGPKSVGTWHAIKYAAKRGVEVRIYPLGVRK